MENKLMIVRGYEAQLQVYKDQVVGGFLGIGRVLNEAQASGAVPRGEWVAWVEAHSGMGIRKAQRCMQAAREIPDGSAMAALGMTKAVMLLDSGMDENERESMAAQAESMTTRQLEAAIKQAKEEAQKEAKREAANQMAAEREELSKRFAREFEKVQQDAADRIDNDTKRMRAELEAAKQENARLAAIGGDRDKLLQEIEDLEDSLQDSEQARRAAVQQLNMAKTEAAQARDFANEGVRYEAVPLDGMMVKQAVSTFMGVVGDLPYIRPNGSEWETARASVQQVLDWAQRSLDAMNIVGVI